MFYCFEIMILSHKMMEKVSDLINDIKFTSLLLLFFLNQ